VITMNNQVITKTYSRRTPRINKKKNSIELEKSPDKAHLIFGSMMEDYDFVVHVQGTPLKRNPTPVSTEGLRCSARKAPSANGFKPCSPAMTRSKSMTKKVPNKVSGVGKNSQPSLSLDFPDLEAIDNMMASSALHLEVLVDQRQKVVVTCEIPPMKVTAELLLVAKEKVHESKEVGGGEPYRWRSLMDSLVFWWNRICPVSYLCNISMHSYMGVLVWASYEQFVFCCYFCLALW
jgi:hypothetical protein